ncbi:MAG: bifunctional methionine sulfoxide reductase B/A protein [Candidatus Hydrogenedentes bacterium]|nr:bifunctional methionine sulfoxide reductase B/A protein [Candidatus Hydrogenedentota bacterium]
MKTLQIALLALVTCTLTHCSGAASASGTPGAENVKLNPLTPEEEHVIVHKGTERPFTGEYEKFDKKGTYICKWCNAPLYKSESKFDAGCGWPAFDDEIPGAVKRTTDADGRRTEITCARCGGHLGHVFTGEGFTPKNTRHCVNSISIKFVADGQPIPEVKGDVPKADAAATKESAKTEKAIFAGGCFWGVQYLMQKAPGVISTQVGYTGGHKDNPTYKEVCSGTTGHIEAIEITFDPSKTTYEALAKLFFEIHDPTQANGQGPDIGEQYLSVVFYANDAQKQTAEKLIQILKDKGYKVVTQVLPAKTFWPAEDYHQDYYNKKHGTPYCHAYKKRF